MLQVIIRTRSQNLKILVEQWSLFIQVDYRDHQHPLWQQNQSARSGRNVGPPQFYGERRYVDNIEETETLPIVETKCVTPPAFPCCSPSDFITPITISPQKQTMVAETTLTWSSNNSTPTGAVHSVSMTSTLWKSPNGKCTTRSRNDED